MPYKRKQLGLTLVELMIAMALGLALIGAAIQFSLSSRQIHEVTQDTNFLTQNGRLAFALLSKDLRMGGYADFESDRLPDPFFQGACGADDPCTANEDDEADRFAIVYEPRLDDLSARRDCTGAAIDLLADGRRQLIANQYYLQIANGVGTLMCRSFDLTPGEGEALSTSSARGDAVALIDGIDDMQVLYGIPSATETIRFINAGGISAANAWGDVEAIRVAMLISSGTATQAQPQRERTYALLDGDVRTYDDRVIRQIYTSTIELKNNYEQQ